MRTKPPLVFLDSFDSAFNESFWSAHAAPGTTTETSQGRFVVTMGADTPDGFVSSGIDSICRLAGNYDVRVDYRLLQWPAGNGVTLGLGVDFGTVGRLNDAYLVKFLPSGTQAATTDETGSLRLVRSGRELTAYYSHEGRWVWLWQSDGSAGETRVQLSLSSNAFSHEEVSAAFDNFRVVRGRLDCP